MRKVFVMVVVAVMVMAVLAAPPVVAYEVRGGGSAEYSPYRVQQYTTDRSAAASYQPYNIRKNSVEELEEQIRGFGVRVRYEEKTTAFREVYLGWYYSRLSWAPGMPPK